MIIIISRGAPGHFFFLGRGLEFCRWTKYLWQHRRWLVLASKGRRGFSRHVLALFLCFSTERQEREKEHVRVEPLSSKERDGKEREREREKSGRFEKYECLASSQALRCAVARGAGSPRQLSRRLRSRSGDLQALYRPTKKKRVRSDNNNRDTSNAL